MGKIGIIGYGSAGRRIERLLLQMGTARDRITTYDTDPDAGATKIFGDMRLGDDVDDRIVFICSPTDMHEGHLRALTRTTEAVYVEKPLVSSRQGDISGVIDRLSLDGCLGAVGYNMRFHPGIVAAKTWTRSRTSYRNISAHATCHVDMASWPGKRYGSALEECSHELDMLLYLLGPGEVRDASYRLPAWTESRFLHGSGRYLLRIDHSSGACSHVEIRGNSSAYLRRLLIHDNAGRFGWQTQDFTNVGDLESGDCLDLSWSPDVMYMEALDDFLDHAESGMRLRGCTLKDGAQVATWMLQAESLIAEAS